MGFPLSSEPRYAGFTHKTRPKRPAAPQPDARLAAMGRMLAAEGRGEDDLVAHINRREARLLTALGGAGTRNARTGLLQFDDTDETETPEEEGTPAQIVPADTQQPIPADQLQAQADATLRTIGPIPTSEPGPAGWSEQAQGIRSAIAKYVSDSAMHLAQIPHGIEGVIQDFRSDPGTALEKLGPTLNAISPGAAEMPALVRSATTVLRQITPLLRGTPAEAEASNDRDASYFYPEERKLPQEPTGDVFHYAFSRTLDSIMKNGLQKNSYATTAGDLSPLQAQIDLALAPNHGPRDSVLRIDLAALRRDGEPIPVVTKIARDYNMPGGGYEVAFPKAISPKYLKVVPRE